MNTCLICDDHVLVREALEGSIKLAWPTVKTTGVGDFPSAWAEAAKGYDMCVADLYMPGADPLDGVRGLQRAAPAMPILIVTGTEDDGLMLDLLELGVSGFTPKTASGGLIEAALRLIHAGGRYLPPRLAEIAASRIDTGAVTAKRAASTGAAEGLTERQIAVLRLIAKGRSNKEIARSLALAPSTVKTHVANIQAFLGATNRTDASIRAQAMNLL
jgi:DNA-binding NarL/FixJ family response regulator